MDLYRQCISCADEKAYERIREHDIIMHVAQTKLRKGTGAISPGKVGTDIEVADDDLQTIVDVPYCIPPMERDGVLQLLEEHFDTYDVDDYAFDDISQGPHSGHLKIAGSKIPGCDGDGLFWVGPPIPAGTLLGYLWGRFVSLGSPEADKATAEGRLVRGVHMCDVEELPLFVAASNGSAMSYINCPSSGMTANCRLTEDVREVPGAKSFPVITKVPINTGSTCLILLVCIIVICHSYQTPSLSCHITMRNGEFTGKILQMTTQVMRKRKRTRRGKGVMVGGIQPKARRYRYAVTACSAL